MGLTRPRAYQIFDIDYKQSVRVITLSNITLSGGAPTVVDSVTLSSGDRVLVAGQSTGSQNGLYQVSVLGTGSNGTWIRSVDGNETGEIDAGMIVMVTEGDIYKDTQWKLTTNDPIVIGTTALTFEQNSAFAFGNIFANGTAVLADIVGDTVTFTPGNNFIITGNATSDTVTFAVSESPTFTGNVSGSNLTTAGQVSATGNVTGGNLITAGLGSFGTTVSATGNVTGGNLVSNARIDGGNLYLTSLDANKVVFTGANGQLIDSQNFTFDGVTANIQGALIVDNVEINSNSVSSTVGNLLLEAPLGSFVSVPGNLLIDGLITGNLLPSANITYSLGSSAQRWKDLWVSNSTIYIGEYAIATTGNLLTFNNQTVITANSNSSLTTTGNVTGGNINTAGVVRATGDVFGKELWSTQSSGDEGGQINFGIPATNTSLTGQVTIDVYQNRLRFFQGDSSRGAYIDLTQANAGVGTNLLAGGGGGTPGGANTYVQFNDGGLFGGNASFTYDKVLNTLTAGTFAGTLNGTGQNFKVGDDAWIGDINIADTIGLKGQQNAANCYIVFGNSDSTGRLGRAGTGPLTYAGAFTATGNISGGNLSGTSIVGTLTTAAQTNITSVGALNAGSITSGFGTINIGTDTVTCGGIINANSNGVGNIGSSTTYFNTVFAKATSSQYADVAERYEADANYPVGTVLIIGGDKEVTQSTSAGQSSIAGTVSENPGVLMNRGLEGEYVASVALLGRVPCRVVGRINKGDLLMSSEIPGVACKMTNYTPGCVIGKALENHTVETEGTIEIMVGRL
jgi:hypothetical protein